MRFTFVGAYDPAYPRSAVIRRGLLAEGHGVRECRLPPRRYKFWARYPLLAGIWLRSLAPGAAPGSRADGGPARFEAPRAATPADRGRGVVFVPEFCQKDVPIARLLSLLSAQPLVFDPLAARYETKVLDRRRVPLDSPSAWWNRRLDAAAFALSDLVLADTAAHGDYYVREYGLAPGKVRVLPLGYDEGTFVPLPAASVTGGPGRPFTVLFFGSFLPLHGVDVVVEAARLVERRDPGIRFLAIGTGQTLPAVRAAAAGLENVEFLGWRTVPEIVRAAAGADLCLGIFGRTAKARRVVPHKIFQAMGLGRAVVTARTPAVEEIFAEGETIRLCDEPLAASLAETVLALRADPAGLERIARRGGELVRSKFTSRRIAGRLAAIVEERFGR